MASVGNLLNFFIFLSFCKLLVDSRVEIVKSENKAKALAKLANIACQTLLFEF